MSKRIRNIEPGVPVILADGAFPTNKIALEFLDKSACIICCDGATQKLLNYGLSPHHIVGDMDSLPLNVQSKFKDIILVSNDQETNDLTKAINLAIMLGLTSVAVLGATGLREDHTLGNIGLLAEHGNKLKLQMISDYGIFTPLYEPSELHSRVGQQISMFALLGARCITTKGLKYPLNNDNLNNLWNGTLNEAVSEVVSLEFSDGCLIVYQAF